jgi:ribosomal protein S18 acetylase RimI-like enzyme
MESVQIRQGKKEDLPQLIKVYKEAFKIHNIFKKSEKEIIKHWESSKVEPDDFVVALKDGKVVAGCLVTMQYVESHTLARIKHIAVAEAFRGKGIGRAIMEKAEEIIGTGKIEIHVAENEKIALPFYKKLGYKQEGILSDHYRKGESCYLLGKYVEAKV